MSGVGFDIGNHSCVVAEATPRTVHVVLDAESEYETSSMVSFTDKERQFGTAAKALFVTNPRETIAEIKSLIGRPYEEIEKIGFMFPISKGGDGGILIHGPVDKKTGTEPTYSPVQMLAMLLSHLKKGAEENMGVDVSDCVIGIPGFFTDLERTAYLDAAKIAGMKPRQLMHEGTAIALGYGYYRTDIKTETIVAFVDVGHCSTQITVVKFDKNKMGVLSHAWDRKVGSRDFDRILLKYFSKKLKDIHGIDVDNLKPRSRARLMLACEKAKKVLTTNTEALLTIESFVDGNDVFVPIERKEFEKLLGVYLNKLKETCKKGVADANLRESDIKSVEVVGSGSRIPAVAAALTEYFGMELSRTLNSIECVARGCALQCALLDESSPLKSYKVEDSYPLDIHYDLVGKVQPHELFRKGQTFPSTTSVKVYARKDESCAALQSTIILVPVHIDEAESYETWTKRSFKINHRGSIDRFLTVELKISLNINGISVVEMMTLGEGNQESRLSRNEDQWGITETSIIGMTETFLQKAIETERNLAEKDLREEDTMRARNTLESYIYSTREKLMETYQIVATDLEAVQLLESRLDAAEQWLYDDIDDESKDKYEEKLISLKAMVHQLETRYENVKRDPSGTKERLDDKNGDIQPSEFQCCLKKLHGEEYEKVHANFSCLVAKTKKSKICNLLRGWKNYFHNIADDKLKNNCEDKYKYEEKIVDLVKHTYTLEVYSAIGGLQETIKELCEKLYLFPEAKSKCIFKACTSAKLWLQGDEKFQNITYCSGPWLNEINGREKHLKNIRTLYLWLFNELGKRSRTT